MVKTLLYDRIVFLSVHPMNGPARKMSGLYIYHNTIESYYGEHA